MPKITKGDYEWLSQRILQECLAPAIPETTLTAAETTCRTAEEAKFLI
jgi:hypothetical protein